MGRLSIFCAFVLGLTGVGAFGFEVKNSNAFTPRYCTAEELSGASNTYLKGEISFSQAEIALHDANVGQSVEFARGCARSALSYQSAFSKISEHHNFSPYIGADYFDDVSGQLGQLTGDSLTAQQISIVAKGIIPVSCVGVALKCLEEGFVKAGLGELWTKIHKFRCANQSRGIAIQFALHKLGWETVYWGSDAPSDFPGLVKNGDQYTYGSLNLPVSKPNGYPDTNIAVPDVLKSVPFGFGAADDGYHVFIATTTDRGEFVTIEGSRGAGPTFIDEYFESEPNGAYYQNLTGNSGVMSDYGHGIIAIPPK